MANTADRLPGEFLQEMEKLLGKEEFAQYRASFEQEENRGLRVNERKISAEAFTCRCAHPLRPVPWISNGFIYDSSWVPSKDVDYFAGLYYLQEPSAMTPASLLPVKPGDRVLDLCAAPGGKATELGVKLQGRGLLWANDISNSRAMALLKNLELFGIPNICITSEMPEKLAGALGGFFNKILVDAPCSGEGMFRREPAMVRDWQERGPGYYQPIQQKILGEAIKLLAPGGYLLYSTCTFSVRENEENIVHLLKQYPEMELVPLPLFPGAADGIGLSGVLRLFPHRVAGEGHFAALLRKNDRGAAGCMAEILADNKDIFLGRRDEIKEENQKKRKGREKPGEGKKKKISKGGMSGNEELWKEAWEEFERDLSVTFAPSRIRFLDQKLYYLPEDFPEEKALRYLRTGLLLGELKNGRFVPGQALAMELRAEDFCRRVCFSRSDERVFRYLKGETISLKEEEEEQNGWCLVVLEGGFPLGWAKGMGKQLKNKYYPGWRYQG